ncbi:hypothetical protein TRFO_29272 [Tritrichomonas foetus]|uniref:Surface antigen BspA-like n=1 Tax=Tritrichomonas foetus TaxID=1144522 RepID=A0A1J4JW42_9EUKA|nr:hypothetical protein TRFO_29272 [Tritrichomonas foetus]|eukprot:OHT03351.1 hypothetical protein TRFO_29272 [Tritrichomonas foetus]
MFLFFIVSAFSLHTNIHYNGRQPLALKDTNEVQYKVDGTEMTITGDGQVTEDGVVSALQNVGMKKEELTKVSIDGPSVIDGNSFNGCQRLKEVVLSKSVENIQTRAFYMCISLESIDLVNVNSVGPSAFQGCAVLKEVKMYSSLKYINDYAFADCPMIQYIDIPKSVVSLGAWSFVECNAAERLTFDPDCPITSIPKYCFCQLHKITEVTLPKYVSIIEQGAFYHCPELKSITISERVETIGESAFSYCMGMTEFIVHEANPNYKSIDGVLYNKEGTLLLQYPLKRGPTYVLPNTVVEIKDLAIASTVELVNFSCEANSKLSILPTLTFWYAEKLKYVQFPASLTNFSTMPFMDCPTVDYFTYCGTAVGNVKGFLVGSNIVYVHVTDEYPAQSFAGRPVKRDAFCDYHTIHLANEKKVIVEGNDNSKKIGLSLVVVGGIVVVSIIVALFVKISRKKNVSIIDEEINHSKLIADA